MCLIGMAYKKQVGKDTGGDYLVKTYGFYTTSFACEVKRIAKEVFGWDGNKDEKGRKLLQIIGTDCGRAYSQNIWINKFDEKFGLLINSSKIVITDVRFVNECEYIKSKGGIIINVTRNTGVLDSHLSETELDGYTGFDYTIDNNGSIIDYHTELDAILIPLTR